ncbi:uncharacterized protein LOC113206781 isoform X6 [Frankliniella occidentalis]|uniref:Uncharacterized protein LOC113206781 isoform X6 n=1 Tax=Frankliniella occidentalis TaxID=133901 RepID=A0A9C6XVB9_FRAOC|nr:uncharacterized protein LOC113206781 isoform X6 [Frankliniella occidentalis]
MSTMQGGHHRTLLNGLAPEPARCSMAIPGLVPLLLTVVLGAVAARRRANSTYLEFRPRFLRPCVGERDNALVAMDVTTATYEKRGRTTVVFSVNMTYSRTADQWYKGVGVIEKCDQIVSAATCRVFRVLETKDICGLMMNPAMPWFKIVEDVQPKLSCPITEGSYTLSNGRMSLDLLSALSGTLQLEGPVWRLRGHIVNSRGALQFCMDAAGELFRVRKRRKKTSSEQ